MINVEVPRKLKPLLYPKRYKGLYGGRGGAKSHFFAEQVVLQAYMKTMRIVCIREVQNSIKDSVKQLLVDKIEKYKLHQFFEILESEIRGINGSIIVFKGMQSYNASNIKSLEGFDIAWVEEAQTLSQHSLDLLRPTIRKEDKSAGTESELWFSWNPRYKTDAVDKFFRKSPPDDAISIMVNWYDNPWFPDVLRKEMLHDFDVDADKAEHIWNGAYGASQGAILARWVGNAERENRLHNEVEYDFDGHTIEVSSDLGFRDTASFWYWQRTLGGFKVLKYEGDTGLDADDWIPRIHQSVLELGCRKPPKIWLPHDARAKTFQSKHTTIEKFAEKFGAGNVQIVPISKKLDQIEAARTVIQRCEFNRDLCEDGLDGLRAWEFSYNDDSGVFSREPVHNWASHPSDAFAYGCQVMMEVEPSKQLDEPNYAVTAKDGYIQTIPLNDLWKESPKRSNRI
ncbi:MAG: PBSX family phage terminase large subunit [Paludibacter sp.]|nr:PBSX family phage terminase large subunit [Paludibacter sp.]